MSSWCSIDYSPRSNNNTHTNPYCCSFEFIEEEQQQRRREEKMVKFSKQFEGQLIPEWKEAFVDYWQLKKELKRINLLNNTTNTNNNSPPKNMSFFSSLRNFSLFSHQHREHGPIQVHKKLASSTCKGDMYETELLEQFADTDATKEFFACLDQQLNKVNKFYRTKEKEFLERGDSLKKQMDILVELKFAFMEKQQGRCNSSQESKEDQSISCTFSSEEDSVRSREQHEEMQDNCNNEDMEKNEVPFPDSPQSNEAAEKPSRMKGGEDEKLRTPSGRLGSFRGKNVRINIPLTTPARTFSAISYLVKEDLLNQSSRKCSQEGGANNNNNKLHLNKTKLHHAEKMIKRGFIELHKGLGYLKVYRNLNMLAFMKILKKFDKVTEKQILPIYLKVVESSYFNSSDKVVKFMDEVEELFVKNFAKDDRRKAMKYLRPSQRKESHAVTFFIGLFTGCFVALFAGYVIMAHVSGLYKVGQQNSVYMETVYPVLSMFSLMFLHFFLYGCNIFAWRKTRINYGFIFELAPTKELKYRDVFLICSMAMASVVGVMFLHLTLLTKGYSYSQVQAIPGLLFLAFLLILVCPFNIISRSSRYRFLCVIRNIILSPLYKVVMLDFFMADQLCSQVPMLRNLEYVACYYITGSYKTQDYGYCMRTTHYRDLAYAVSFLPYYWRAMQCARRWFDEGDTGHLLNLGKYVSAMLAAGTKVAYEKDGSVGWLCLVVIMSSAATMYQLYWDFVKDWGLLQVNSKNPWLRNELMLSRKSIYYISMGLNFTLRLAWLQTVLHSSFEHVDYRVTSIFLAALEVIRRGMWNFYRLENEHLNNAGKFRAVKIIPLPFHEVDEED
ncbi:phosphate transporter PHO1 homolog 1 [Arachis ipaensis]|uniref:phosphate transporter PHO1 homolog 1 n=1 Tax=Arachis ipaensis TaxID=130454 RepID=UPI0007AF0DCF|nr:phosphate transporter PHO1 homolog 1 [Arachis ipaensis]